jgi:translation initiation factor IF-3
VIDQDQNQIGIIPLEEAQGMARDAGLDLVEVGPTERPPVCRIMDYGKHKYLQKKKQKAGQHAHTVSLKEVRLRPSTDSHDREIKVNKARSFLDSGHKVQFTMLFRGRERAHRDAAMITFKSIVEDLGEKIKIERPPTVEGRRMTMVVSPGK